MTENQTCDWIGASGNEYAYHVHQLPVNFNSNQDGNYIYTKIENQNWIPIYIGQGDLGDRIGPNHHQASCIDNKNATHVHTHLNEGEQSRTDEEEDLLANYPMAYKPTGCNERTGG